MRLLIYIQSIQKGNKKSKYIKYGKLWITFLYSFGVIDIYEKDVFPFAPPQTRSTSLPLLYKNTYTLQERILSYSRSLSNICVMVTTVYFCHATTPIHTIKPIIYTGELLKIYRINKPKN